MATFDVRLPLQSGRKMPERLMSGFDPKQTYRAPALGLQRPMYSVRFDHSGSPALRRPSI